MTKTTSPCFVGAHSRRLIEAFERGDKFISETTIGGVTEANVRWATAGREREESFTYESFLMHRTVRGEFEVAAVRARERPTLLAARWKLTAE